MVSLQRDELVRDDALKDWVLQNAAAGQRKLYFTINGDVPLTSSTGDPVYYEIPVQGKRVCVLHPDHLTRVAQICYEVGVQMIQVMV